MQDLHRWRRTSRIHCKLNQSINHAAVTRAHFTDYRRQTQQAFRAQKGQGLLFHTARNVKQSDKTESVPMTTGQNVIRWLNCQTCDAYLGWSYDRVPSPDQEYKLDKFLLEAVLLCYI